MSQFASFALSFGGFLALMALVAAWLLRATASPLWLKIIVPSLMIGLACYAPYSVATMMGYPVSVSASNLPDHAELVAFVPHDEQGRVDLWLGGSDVPRAYETALTAEMKKTLREAEKEMAQGRRVVLAKKARGTDSRRGGDSSAVGQDNSNYVLDQNALGGLPPKE